MKTLVITLSIIALLFAQVPHAEAISFKEIKHFLIGGGESESENVIETNLLGASALYSLTSTSELTIHPLVKTINSTVGTDVAKDSATFVFEIEAGDTLWDRIEVELETAFPDMTIEQENFVIDSIIDEMRNMSESELHDIGVSSGNVDLIFPDETISFAVEISGDTLENIELN